MLLDFGSVSWFNCCVVPGCSVCCYWLLVEWLLLLVATGVLGFVCCGGFCFVY